MCLLYSLFLAFDFLEVLLLLLLKEFDTSYHLLVVVLSLLEVALSELGELGLARRYLRFRLTHTSLAAYLGLVVIRDLVTHVLG